MAVYRMVQEERSVFWEVILSDILSKTVYMYMCPIPKCSLDGAISLYSNLGLALITVPHSRMSISVKRQFTVVTVDSDIVGMF
jgi:hypothetical protein